MRNLISSIRHTLSRTLSPRTRVKWGLMLRHRKPGFALLSGTGLEIGALHIPAHLPAGCKTDYADAITTEQARAIFPEVNAKDFVPVSLIVDLDKSGLARIPDGQYDYVILNHVIEHVANPVKVVGELFRVIRSGGHVVISAPDKHFTFDRERELTPFSHLKSEFDAGIQQVTDDHYADFVNVVVNKGRSVEAETFRAQIADARMRREHAHVWDSESFHDFLEQSLCLHDISATPRFVSDAKRNKYEYFSVLQKA